jgi:autotransporter-associated beta strand protein
MFRRVELLVPAATIVGLLALGQLAHAQLSHRWSFDGNTNDSVGGVNGTLNGGATVAGGQLVLDGIDDFMSLASSPLPSGTGQSATFEVWGTYATDTPAGSRIFEFSNGDRHYLNLTPNSTVNTPTVTPSTGPETRFRYDDDFGEFGIRSAGGSNTGSQVLLTAVADFPNNLLSLYRDGGLLATTPMLTTAGVDFFRDLADANSFRFGHGQSASAETMPDLPGFLNGSINEFRIYNNPLSAAQILTNAIAGPNVPSVSLTDKTWNAGSSSWNTGGNWTAAGVPDSTNRAVIANGGTATVSTASPNVGAIQITNGALTIANSGTLESVYPIQLAPGAGNTSTINVNSSNSLAISGIVTDVGEGNRLVNIDGGTIKAGFANTIVQPNIAINIGAGGATIDSQANTMTWTTTANLADATLGLTGTGTITKSGSGRLNLYTTTPADRDAQSQSFTGEFHINQGTVDIAGSSGVFGRAGTRGFGKVTMNDSTLLMSTASGESREFGADLHVVGDNVFSNLNGAVRELRMQGSITGDGTLRFRKPNVAAASGLDFEIFEDPANGIEFPDVTNANFTGRVVVEGNYAVRFRSGVQNSRIDFPNAIFEVADAGAWIGKRGPDGDATTLQSIIELGGVESVGAVEDPANPGTFFYPRLEGCIAGCNVATNPLMTYQIGGANQDAEFRGIIQDTVNAASPTTTNETVRITKVGNNTQTFSGPNTYSGATTVNGGTLLVNGTHQMHATSLLPVGDYSVNAGGTLGGTGTIGSATDTVNVVVNGGTLAPGASIGTLTVDGTVSFDASSHFAIEISGTTVDLLDANGLNITNGAMLDILPVGNVTAGQYVIAMANSISGMFALNAPAGFSIAHNATSIVLTAPDFSGGVAGDYNEDGVVDAADYTVWRDRLGQSTPLPNTDPTDMDGQVTTAEYNFWKSRFGATSGAGSSDLNRGTGAVPEPTSCGLVLLAFATILGAGRHRQ